jgi:uncharacterized membrane protein
MAPRLIALALLCTTACATTPPGPATETYRAVGTEPFWSVTVADGRMTYDAADGAAITAKRPQPRTSFNGHRYETPQLTVDVTHGECSDAMSDRRYPDRVMVVVDGKTLHGCGGEARRPPSINQTSWRITQIDGADVPAGLGPSRYLLRFADGLLRGRASCNTFSGAYTLSGNRLVPGAIIMTTAGCVPAALPFEERAFLIMSRPVELDYVDVDTMVLGGEGGTLTLRRVY